MRYSLVFLTYNRLGIVARCLRSLAPTLRREDVEWVILDNASTDGTAEWVLTLSQQYPNVRALLMGRNLGVAGGRDVLYGEAQGEVIISLDSDVEARRSDWLKRLTAPLERPDVGLCGPGGCWVVPDWSNFVGPADPAYTGEVDVVSGFCQAFRRDVLDRGVALDQHYNPRWHEDSDFALQIRALGYQVWHTGDVGLFHVFAHTGDDGSGRAKLAYFARKWHGRGLVLHERESVGMRVIDD